MLKQRILTAVILIPIVVGVIFYPDTRWFSLLFALFVAFGSWEWAALCGLKGTLQNIYSVIIIFILGVLYWFNNTELLITTLWIAVVFWLIAIVLVVLYQQQRNLLPKSSFVLMFIGFLLLLPMWSSLHYLKNSSPFAAHFLMALMLLVWSADTAAYFAGKRWGKRKLATRVSPGKTWEGTFAGVIAGIVISLCYVIVSVKEFDEFLIFTGLLGITVMVSVFGDLMESMVKRELNIKDSGTILPGHGGVMDRIDSLTAAAPIFVIGLHYSGML